MTRQTTLAACSALLAASTTLLSGCVSAPTVMDVGGTRTFPQDKMLVEMDSGLAPKLPFTVCIIDPGVSRGLRSQVHASILSAYSVLFADAVVAGDSGSGRLCDLEARYPSVLGGDKGSLHSAYTGEQLASASGHFRLIPLLYAKSLLARRDNYDLLSAQRRAHGKPAITQTNPIQPIAASPVTVTPIAAAPDRPAAHPSPFPRYSAAERLGDLAVIVGVESYSDIAAKAPYAERDADAFKAHVRALGVPERNIVLLKGSKAVKSSLEKNLEGWLPRMTKPDSRVYFYFSGHGAPDIKSGQAYLVPWDGDPNFLEATAYPVSRLYAKLGALPAKQVLVAMDSCFSGAGGRSVLASGARPLVGKIETGAVPPNLTVLAASAASEISGSLDDHQHGAFTYFLLEGLNAGKTSAKALHAYLTPKVQDEARRLNRDQTPQLLGADLPLR